jgi:tRNA(Ile)-lysidine synthase
MGKLIWHPWHAKLHQTLKARQLLPAGERVLVAVSGGQDSMGLMQLLLELRRHWQWDLAMVHCNHQWRSDADANAEHVRSAAHNWQVPFWLEVADRPLQSEAAARTWRYQILAQVASQRRYGTVVTGHTASDRAETLVYNLVRGSGADGLQALTWVRPLSPSIRLVRPLLEFTRAETEQICQAAHLPIWFDSTNQDRRYCRNRIRQEVLPYLRQHLNRQVEQHLAQTAELLSAEVEYLESLASQLYNQALCSEAPPTLCRTMLHCQPLALQRRVIRRFLKSHLHHAPSFEHIEKVVSLLAAPNRSRSDSLAGGTIAVVNGATIQLIERQS